MSDRNEAKKQEYIKQSLILFLKKGIKKVKVGEITETLNISSKTLYRFFEDKKGLVYACLELYQNNTALKLDQLLNDESKNDFEIIVETYWLSFQLLSKVNPLFIVDVENYFEGDIALRRFLGSKSMEKIVELGMKNEFLRKDLDVDIITNTFFELLRSYFRRSDIVPGEEGTQQYFFNVIGAYLCGICSKKGIDFIYEQREAGNLDFII